MEWRAWLELWPYLFFGCVIWAYVGRPLYARWTSPKSDLPRIKRAFEGDGRRIVSAHRTGVELEWHGRRPPDVYRRYEFEVARHDGVTKTFAAAVEMTMFGESKLWEFDADSRRIFSQGSKTWFKDVESL